MGKGGEGVKRERGKERVGRREGKREERRGLSGFRECDCGEEVGCDVDVDAVFRFRIVLALVNVLDPLSHSLNLCFWMVLLTCCFHWKMFSPGS